MTINELAERIRAGETRAIARAISVLEDDDAGGAALLDSLHPHPGRACLIGITGAPGAGKSTLVDALITAYRGSGVRVAVLAVDPTSPYTGGALLGDRVRMLSHADDAGVFIRSMASRGQLGGIARATADAALVLASAGFDIVIVETVGVGQDEVEIVRLADVCVVVTVPGTGDDVQAIKAGIMEIADIFVVNKSDRDGADAAAAAIEAMLSLDERGVAWRPPVVRTVANTRQGVTELAAAIDTYRTLMSDAVDRKRHARSEWRLTELLSRMALSHLRQQVLKPGEWEQTLARVDAGEVATHAAASRIVERLAASGWIDHVGIATPSIERSLAFFQEALGLGADSIEEVASQRVRVQFVETGDARVELVEPTSDESAVAKSLQSRGPGLHHLAIRVPDLPGVLASLKARGVRLIDEAPRPGAHGTEVAFVHPAAAGGVLLELVAAKKGPRVHR